MQAEPVASQRERGCLDRMLGCGLLLQASARLVSPLGDDKKGGEGREGKESMASWTVSRLRAELRSRGLRLSGRKAALLSRLASQEAPPRERTLSAVRPDPSLQALLCGLPALLACAATFSISSLRRLSLVPFCLYLWLAFATPSLNLLYHSSALPTLLCLLFSLFSQHYLVPPHHTPLPSFYLPF